MGGYGSGRYGGRSKVQHCRSLDVNKMNKAGGLKPGFSGDWEWNEDGEKVASIGFASTENNVSLKYRHWRNDEEPENVDYLVAIIWKPCRFGGRRAYFRCPGVVNGRVCHRHVIKLYIGGKYFLCRHCYSLAYQSQSETRYDRLLRRANKRRMALGGEPGVYSYIERPKGMWRRTHMRHRGEIIWAEQQATAEFMRMFAGRLSLSELDMFFE